MVNSIRTLRQEPTVRKGEHGFVLLVLAKGLFPARLADRSATYTTSSALFAQKGIVVGTRSAELPILCKKNPKTKKEESYEN